MSNLKIPDNWESVNLDKIISLEYGKGLPKKKRNNGPFPVMGSNGVIDHHNEYLIEGPGIVVGRKGSMGKVTWVNENYWPIDTTYYVKIKNKHISLKWLYYALIQLKLDYLSLHDVIPGLNREYAYSKKILVPNYYEQNIIASVLTNVDNIIIKIKEIINNLKKIKKGMMQRFFMEGIGHTEFKETKSGLFPKTWTIKKLKDIITLEYGKGLPERKRIEGEYPVVGSNGVIDYHNEYFVNGPGIVVGRKGSMGKVSWISNNFWPIDTTYYVTTKNNNIDRKWLYYALINLNLERLNLSDVIPGLNREYAYSRKIAIPRLEEQHKFVRLLENIDNKIKNELHYQNELKIIKKGLMQDLLMGKKRVKIKN